MRGKRDYAPDAPCRLLLQRWWNPVFWVVFVLSPFILGGVEFCYGVKRQVLFQVEFLRKYRL